jgi:hypothetical protein
METVLDQDTNNPLLASLPPPILLNLEVLTFLLELGTVDLLLPLLLMVDGVLLELELSHEEVVVDSVVVLDRLLLDMVLGRMAMLLVRGTRGWNWNSLVKLAMVFTRYVLVQPVCACADP